VPPPQGKETQALQTHILGHSHLRLHSVAHSSHNLGDSQTHKANLHPPRRHRFRLQRHRPQPPHLKLSGDAVLAQPQRQNRHLLRPSQRLRHLPEPASHVPNLNPSLLPRPQGRRRLVPVRLRQQRPRRALQLPWPQSRPV